jgi:hypothetical protein
LRRAIGASLRRPSVADDWQDYQGCAGKSPAVPQPKPLAFKLNPEFKGDFCKIVEGVCGSVLGRTDALVGTRRRQWRLYSLIERIHSVLAAAGARPAHG